MLKKHLIWIPIGLMMIIAGGRLFYWQPYQNGHGHAGGGFSPFSSPFYTNILLVKFRIGNKYFIYKSDMGNPIKVIMLPQKEVINEIVNRITEHDEFLVYNYSNKMGFIAGEVCASDLRSDIKPFKINKDEIDQVLIELWKLNTDPGVLQIKTEYSIVYSTHYPII